MTAQAQTTASVYFTGADLAELCAAKIPAKDRDGAKIAIYAAAASDAEAMLYTLLGKRLFCIPEAASRGALGDVVCRYIKDNPTKSASPGMGLAVEAFRATYPCEGAPTGR